MAEHPINDHRKVAPQPEFCELCGERWPGAEMAYSNVEGLRGRLICGSSRTGCSHFRSALTYKDRRRLWRPSSQIGSGKSPVFPPGAVDWADEDENDAITNPV